MKKVFRQYETYLFFVLVCFSLIVFGINRAFFTLENLFDVLKSSSVIGIMTVGVLVVMISGGIDISFPGIAAVAMYVTVSIMGKLSGNLFAAFILAGAIGIALGMVNALIIAYFKIPTLIVTLGTTNVFFGLLLSSVEHAHISTAQVPAYLPNLGKNVLFSITGKSGQSYGFSNLTLIMIIIFIITWLLLRYTSLGRNIYAIGGSMEAAKRAGIDIIKTQFFIYGYTGFLAGIASIVNVSMVRYVNPFNIMALLIDVIAAVVLGGARISGGAGSVLGTVLGLLMIFGIRNSLILMKIPSHWHSVIVGVIILLSMSITTYRKGRAKSAI